MENHPRARAYPSFSWITRSHQLPSGTIGLIAYTITYVGPCFQYSLFLRVVIPHVGPELHYYYSMYSPPSYSLLIPLNWKQLKVRKELTWKKTYGQWALGRRCLFILSLSSVEVPGSFQVWHFWNLVHRSQACRSRLALITHGPLTPLNNFALKCNFSDLHMSET